MTQPMPTTSERGVDVLPLVIQDLLARSAEGIKTYGLPLRTFNGRSAMTDLYQELLDGAQYCRQEIEERAALEQQIKTLTKQRDVFLHALHGVLADLERFGQIEPESSTAFAISTAFYAAAELDGEKIPAHWGQPVDELLAAMGEKANAHAQV